MNKLLVYIVLATAMVGCVGGSRISPREKLKQRSLAITESIERLVHDEAFLKLYRNHRKTRKDKSPTMLVMMEERDKLLKSKLMSEIRQTGMFDIIDFEEQEGAKRHLLDILEDNEGIPLGFDRYQHLGEYLEADYVLDGWFSVQKEYQTEHYMLKVQDVEDKKLVCDSIVEVGAKE